jgi:hypothetical protein
MLILPPGLVVTILTPPGPHLVGTFPAIRSILRSKHHNSGRIEGLQSGCPASSRMQLRAESGQIVAIRPGCDGSAGSRGAPIVPSVPTTEQTGPF